MLKIANWYTVLHRNDGNPLYVTAALKRLQEKGLLEIDHLQPHGDVAPWGKYDLHFWIDWGEDGLTSILPTPDVPSDAPLIYWASDTHLGYAYRLGMAKKAQLVFCAQKEAVERMKNDGVTAPIYWLPHAVELSAYCDPDRAIIKNGKYTPEGNLDPYYFLSKKYDVAFVGHVNSVNRIEALDRLFKEFPNFFYGQRLFNDAAKIFAQSKIVFNIAMKDDLNMRCFEVMGSKSFLLTDSLRDLHELFDDNYHLVMYKDLDDMVDKAKYYLAHPEIRDQIAENGYEEVKSKHTIDHRVKFMLDKAYEHKLIGELVKV